VESGAVVEGFDVIEDGGASLGVGGEALMVDQFVFEGAKEGFDEGVIVAVEDKSSCGATLTKRHAQCGDDQSGIEDLAHGPADDLPSEDIQDRDEI